CARSGTADYW
nr:immunoglobulin heavy chain junction region [Mus musculus]